jgi:hypothetical protein
MIGLLAALYSAEVLLCQTLPACETRELSIRQNPPGIATGQLDYDFILTNRGNRVCTVSGYPAATALTKSGQVAKQVYFEHQPAMAPEPDNLRIKVIRLRPGANAWFKITTRDGTGMEDLSLCGTATQVEIAPPGSAQAFEKRFPFTACTEKQGITFLLPGLP